MWSERKEKFQIKQQSAGKPRGLWLQLSLGSAVILVYPESCCLGPAHLIKMLIGSRAASYLPSAMGEVGWSRTSVEFNVFDLQGEKNSGKMSGKETKATSYK